MEKSENPFDKAAKEWDDKPRRVDLAMAVAKAVVDMAKPTPASIVLDFGCGTGTLAAAVAGGVAKVVAADTSKGMIERLEEKIAEHGTINIHPIHLPNGAEPRFDDLFDLIVISMTLHHVDDIDALIAALTATLKPKGKLLVADLMEEDGSFHSDMDVPHKGFKPETLSEKLDIHGLKTKKTRVIREIDKNNKKYPVFAPIAEKHHGGKHV